MSYAAPQGLKIFFRVIVGIVSALFLWVIGAQLAKQFYRAYQFNQIEECENEFGLRTSDKQVHFGFDAGGWTVVGDEPRKLAFVECVRDRLNVNIRPASDAPDPSIEISWNSALVSPTVYVSYLPAAPVKSDETSD